MSVSNCFGINMHLADTSVAFFLPFASLCKIFYRISLFGFLTILSSFVPN